MILADKITEERKKNGWSQEELANQLGVSRHCLLYTSGHCLPMTGICHC